MAWVPRNGATILARVRRHPAPTVNGWLLRPAKERILLQTGTSAICQGPPSRKSRPFVNKRQLHDHPVVYLNVVAMAMSSVVRAENPQGEESTRTRRLT